MAEINSIHFARSFGLISAAMIALAGCGGSGGNSRTSNSVPTIQLNDGDVLGGGSSVVRIPASDDTGIASVSATLVRQGKLESCAAQLDMSITQNSLLEACVADQPTCAVEFIPAANEVVVYPPPLYAPVGLEYTLSFIDRDGGATEPVNAVFCFDVVANAAPIPSTDTYQIGYLGTIQRNGVRYNTRCEKQPGSNGVLANDEDDEHITNTCLQAELVDPPAFATSTFANTFRADGGFRYEALSSTPVDDSFTYRVTDGVNGFSGPIRVDIVFSGDNEPPVAVNDSFTVAEDSELQAFSVLANDSDPDELPLTITSIVNGPASGIATPRNGVVIEYRPNADFTGTDRFDYVVADSAGVTTTATVEIQVTPVNDAPVATNDEVATNENIAVTVNVIGNDSDLEGDAITVSSVASPTNGTAVVAGPGTVTYTPNLNYFGVDAFEYTITDTNGAADTATVLVNVISVNVVPLAVEDFYNTNEDQAIVMAVLENDSDGDGDALSIIEISQPANGVSEVVENSIRYTPNSGFSGTDTFNYLLSDGVESAWAQVNVAVSSVNEPPVAVDDQVTTAQGAAISIDVMANDSDPDGDSISIQSATTAPNGASDVVNGAILYTPGNNFSGADSFQYTIVDSNGASATATVSVSVSVVNTAPVASNDTAVTPESVAVSVDVLANDNDVDQDSLSITAVTTPANGTAVISNGNVLYTPNANFTGSDAFGYTVSDGNGGTATASVAVTISSVNAPPVAANDAVTTIQGQSVTFNVLGNDSDPNGDALTVQSLTQPGNGSAAIANSQITYNPASGFSGTDTFTYVVADPDGATATASVTVTVSAVNVAPTANDDNAQTAEGSAVTIDVLANDTDPENDSLALSITGQPGNGAVAIASQQITYTPSTGFSGSDTFIYAISDGNGGTDTATVTVTVSVVNVAPVANADTATTPEGTAISIDVLANDTDANNDSLTLSVDTDASNGTAVVSNSQITYTPSTGFSGDDAFIYAIADGNGGTDTTSVTITVTVVNVAPVAANDTATTPEATAISIDVLVNDSDANNDVLTLTVDTDASNGTAVVSNNQILYTPNAGFSGDDTFIYAIADGNGGTDTASVTVTVTVVNVAPVATIDTATTPEATAISIDVLANDSDANNDVLTLTVDTDATNGTAVVSNNQILYTPDAGFSGDDTFIYAIADGNGGTDTATVTVTVTAVAVNTGPLAEDDTATTQQDIAVVIDVLSNDSDADVGDTLSIASVTNGANGAASTDGLVVTYTPDAGFSGTDSFDYDVSDGNGGTATATVNVTISAAAPPTPPAA